MIGDLMVMEDSGKAFCPGLAPVAMQQGNYVGKVIASRVSGRRTPSPFRYHDKGKLATVGRAFAVADFGRVRVSGRLGWLLWSTVHILYLAGLWNRFQVLATWIWAYITYQRSVRIIAPDSLAVETGSRQPNESGAATADSDSSRQTTIER